MFERSWTVIQAANAVAAVVTIPDLQLPGGEPHLELEAWASLETVTNVYLFEGDVSLTDAQSRIAAPHGLMDSLMVVGHSPACVRIPADIERRMTVYFEAQETGTQAVTVRIRERK